MHFIFNRDTCIKCGLCVEECPVAILKMAEEGPIEGTGSCIECGHCIAICPTDSIDQDRTPRENLTPIDDYKIISPEEAEKFLRYRRSIRNFLPKQVSQEDISRLLNIARMAPTASNSQGVSYFVIQDADKIKLLSETVSKWIHDNQRHDAHMRIYSRVLDKFEQQGKNYIFRNAPTIVLAIVPVKKFTPGRESAHACLTYAELFAPTLKLGSCWAGFFEAWAQTEDVEVTSKIIGLPEGYMVGGVIMLGYPKYKYRSFTDRRPLEITFA